MFETDNELTLTTDIFKCTVCTLYLKVQVNMAGNVTFDNLTFLNIVRGLENKQEKAKYTVLM